MSKERTPRPWWYWAAAVLLLLVAFWFRTYRLADVPPGLHHDDILDVLLVEKIMAGDVRIYYQENYGHEPLYHWLQALYFGAIGTGYPEVRLLSISTSMAGLALVYALTTRLLDRRVALWTLGWQAVSLWPLFYSRRVIRGILLPPLAALAAYLFLRALDAEGPKKTRWWLTWALGGAALSACLYTYMGSRVLPGIFLLWILYLGLFCRRRFQAAWQGMVVFLAVGLVLSLPLGIYLAVHPEERLGQINAPLQALREGNWGPLLQNAGRAWGMFTWIGDPHWRQFVADTPVFGPAGAVFFYAGLLLALWRWRQPGYALSLLWLPLALMPAILSEGAPNFLRPNIAQVVAYLFPALAMAEIVRLEHTRLGRRVAWAAVLLSVAVLVGHAWRTYDGYFVRWPVHPDTRFAYNSTWLEISRYLDHEADLAPVVLSGHFAADLDPALVESFLRRSDLEPRWCDIRQALVYPGGQDARLIQPDYFAIDPALFDLFVAGPPVHEQRLADGTFVFAVYRLERARLESSLPAAAGNPVGASPAAAFPDGRLPDWTALSLPLPFQDRVAFLGYQVLNDAPISPGGQVALLTYWRALQAGPANAVTFMHALDAGGAVVAAYDGWGAPPNRWYPGDVIVQLHRLTLPGDLPPGTYPLELGWYEPGTPERWTFETGSGPADRLLLQPLIVE